MAVYELLVNWYLEFGACHFGALKSFQPPVQPLLLWFG